MTIAGIIVYSLKQKQIPRFNLPHGLLPTYLTYKVITQFIGWYSLFKTSRRTVFTHIYTMMPLIIFSVTMMGSSIPILGYILTPMEAIHMALLYSIIGVLEPEVKVTVQEYEENESPPSYHAIKLLNNKVNGVA